MLVGDHSIFAASVRQGSCFKKAGPDFLRVAAEYEANAQAEKFPAHRDKFLELAKDAKKTAAEYQADYAQFDAKLQMVIEMLEFAQANGRLAAAMERHLELIRDSERTAYLDRLIGLVSVHQRQFDQTFSIWREFLDRRRGAAQSGQPLSPPQPFPGVPAYPNEVPK